MFLIRLFAEPEMTFDRIVQSYLLVQVLSTIVTVVLRTVKTVMTFDGFNRIMSIKKTR